VLHENGNTRQFNGRADGATIARPPLNAEEAARRAAALVGEDSPLRPGGLGGVGRTSAEFAGTLSRLSEAFGQLRSSLQGVEEKLDKTTTGLDQVKERLALEDARMAAFHQRIATLESKQTATLDGIKGQVSDLTRQVSIALGVAMVLATLAIVALFVLR
jgi:hypothetical protein